MTDATAPAPKKGLKGLFRMLFTAVGAAALLGGGFGGGLWYAGGQSSPADEVLRLIERSGGGPAAEDTEGDGAETPQRVPREVPSEPDFVTNYFEFPNPLTTNLSGSTRFLQVSIGVSTQYDTKVIANVETHAMAIRSDVLAVISGFTIEQVEGVEGRARLAEAIRAAINARLETLEGFGGIEDVYFPAFVLQ
jgi:flagellar protein FliL